MLQPTDSLESCSRFQILEKRAQNADKALPPCPRPLLQQGFFPQDRISMKVVLPLTWNLGEITFHPRASSQRGTHPAVQTQTSWLAETKLSVVVPQLEGSRWTGAQALTCYTSPQWLGLGPPVFARAGVLNSLKEELNKRLRTGIANSPRQKRTSRATQSSTAAPDHRCLLSK
ncbi:uncharacterized protein LOC116660893 isoform X2 [Camelus ferus]|uniref:Uncharacterized protein LOC116660893 isoform X2 n=1 Tax=Camelus ferus TaxID=419612 RepID=A0A8B8SBW3_CAMFR|nr:uncharacterized protein LOC116660893 isoform X2 [Camelus ferus]